MTITAPKIAAILDAISPIQRIKYGAELASLADEVKTTGAIRQLAIAKRIAEIVADLGGAKVPSALSAEAFAGIPQPRYNTHRLPEAIDKINQARAAGRISNVELKFVKDQGNRALEGAWAATVAEMLSSDSARALPNHHELYFEVMNRPEMHTLKAAKKRLQASAVSAEGLAGEIIGAGLAIVERFMPLVDAIEELKGMVIKREIKTEEQKATERKAAAVPTTRVSQLVHDVVVAQRPEIEDEYRGWVRRSFDYYVKDYGPAIQIPVSEYRARESFNNFVGKVLEPQKAKGDARQISEQKVSAAAAQYAQLTIEAVITKIMQKAGELEEPSVLDFKGASFTITGKLKGKSVVLRQQVIVNSSVNGTLFNQYPLRITLGGKAVSEAEYKTFMLS